MNPAHAMSPAEGAALRVQLDGLRTDVQRLLDDAVQRTDIEVLRLISTLTEAHDLACAISFRREDEPAYRGVSLVKA